MVMAITRQTRPKGNILNLLHIREVRNDCLILRAAQAPKIRREYMAVLKVEPINFPLMAHDEQETIIEGFRAYLASLTPQDHAISIHARIRPYDIGPYMDELAQTAQTHPLHQYRDMARSHQAFVQRLAASRSLLKREFFVRVTVVVNVKSRQYKRLTETEVFDQARAELARTVNDVMAGLSRAGIMSSRLYSEQLVNYYLSCIHSTFAEDYGLPGNVLATLDYPVQALVPYTPSLADGSDPSDGEAPSEDSAGDTLAGERGGQQRQWVWQSSAQIRSKQANGLLGRRLRRGAHNDDLLSAGDDGVPDLVSLPELVQPASIESTPHYIRVHHNTDEYIRGRAVIGYPAYVVPGWFDQMLALDEPYVDIILFVETLDSARYVRSLSRKLTGYNATSALDERHGKTEDPYIAAARNDVEEVRNKLVAKTELVHAFSLYVLSRAESKQTLRERDKKVANLLKSLELQSVALQYEHLQAWLSCVDARDILHRVRKLDTSTVACAMPFCSSNLSTEPGALIGLTPSGGLVIIDPTSNQLENGHLLTFAKSGSGKSFSEKMWLMRQLLMGMDGVVIDPDNEFQRICEQFGGTNIRLSPGSLQINPFDLGRFPQSDFNPLEEKLQSLLTLFDLLLAEKDPGVLPQREKSYLHKMVMRAYANRGITRDPTTHEQEPPNMREVYALLTEDGDPFQLADRLLRSIDMFPERTAVELKNQLVVFNLQDLKDPASALLRTALYVITDFVWNLVRKDPRPRPRLLLIDEAWVLVEFLEGGQFLANLSRGARKYNLHLHMVSQNVDDFLSSKAGQTIMLNSAMKMLMHHDSTSLDTITRAFKLSEEERKFLLTAPKGQGLFFCRSSHVPLLVVASEEEYRLANTNPNELLLEDYLAQQQEAEAINQQEAEALILQHNQDDLHILFPRVYAPESSSDHAR